MTNQPAEPILQNFANAVMDALVGAISETCGLSSSRANSEPANQETDGVPKCRIKLAFSGNLTGTVLLEFQRSEAALLASQLLRRPVDEIGEEESDALLTMVRAGTQRLLSKPELVSGRVAVDASMADEPASDQMIAVRASTIGDSANSASVLMYFSPEFAKAIVIQSGAENCATFVQKTATAEEATKSVPPANLNLVLDVELNVTLRFGQRHLTLREVLELASGSVVELDRQVEEPVELLLDGIVIAKGEAVVVDGNYGLRVTEVSQSVSSQVLR